MKYLFPDMTEEGRSPFATLLDNECALDLIARFFSDRYPFSTRSQAFLYSQTEHHGVEVQVVSSHQCQAFVIPKLLG